MAVNYTSREDLGQSFFKWQCAFLALWLILVLYLAHQFPRDLPVLLFFLPIIGFIGVGLFPGSGFDFQGLVSSGSFYCCFLSPDLYKSFLENRVWDLMQMSFSILSAMVFGFFFFRIMGKAFQWMG